MNTTDDTCRELTSDELNLVSGGVLSACELDPVCVEYAINNAVSTWNRCLWSAGIPAGPGAS